MTEPIEFHTFFMYNLSIRKKGFTYSFHPGTVHKAKRE